jgi:hypothetical protein
MATCLISYLSSFLLTAHGTNSKSLQFQRQNVGFLTQGSLANCPWRENLSKDYIRKYPGSAIKKLQLLTCACCEVVSGISSIEKTG